MIEVDLPEDEAVPELSRSFAACVASVTETPIAEVPQPHADLPGAIGHWRSWLAGRGAGLVTLAKSFSDVHPRLAMSTAHVAVGAERPTMPRYVRIRTASLAA